MNGPFNKDLSEVSIGVDVFAKMCFFSLTANNNTIQGVNKNVPITPPATAYPLLKSTLPSGYLNEYTNTDCTATATVPIANEITHLNFNWSESSLSLIYFKK